MRAPARILTAGAAALMTLVFLGPVGAEAATPHVLTVSAQVSASNWTTMPNTNNTANQTNGMASVSCVTSGWCVAVGNGGKVSVDSANIELWNGTTWSPMMSPVVSGETDIYLNGVSCATTSFCVAVGAVDTTTFAPLIETWNGTTWSVVQSSPLSSTSTFLSGVSCLSSSFCMAVGWIGAAGGSGLVEQWNGSTWTATTILQAFQANIHVYGVSCTTPVFCMFVGDSVLAGTSNTGPFTDYWNGSTWTGTYQPPISSNTDYHLYGVSCVGTKFCTAVGDTQTGGQPPTLYGQTWYGDELFDSSAWTTAAGLPAVSGGANLRDISCFSATSCTAVGGTPNTLAVTWNGASWTLQTTPTGPSTSNQSAFYGVDCLTDWACVAVGNSANGASSLPLEASAPIARSGYRFVASDGGIFSYGAPFLGSMGGQHLNKPIVGMAVMPAGDGYYLVASDGGIFTFGSAQYFGSTGSFHLNAPIVGMAVTADGGGYWLVASDGGVFSFGDAQFYGSAGGIKLNKPIVGMAPTPNGQGYYLVASDGGIFSYGNALFEGSAGSIPLNKPVVGMTVPASGGYYLVASDGGIFSYPGTLPFYGSAGSINLNKPVVGMASVAGGYYLVASDGGIFSYPGTLPFLGSHGGQPLNAPIVGIGA